MAPLGGRRLQCVVLIMALAIFCLALADSKMELDISSSLNEAGRPGRESVETLVAGAGTAKVFVYHRRREPGSEDGRTVLIASFDARGLLRLPAWSVAASAGGMGLDSGKSLGQLWERLSRSIRMRPVGKPRRAAAAN